MFSIKRMLIGLAIYMAYILALAALVDEMSPALYMVLLFAGIGVLLFFTATGRLTTPSSYRRVMARGLDATATILDISDTGVTVNKNPYVKMKLLVQPIVATPYEAEVKALVSRIAIPRVGDSVQVKYDPDKPQDVIVV